MASPSTDSGTPVAAEEKASRPAEGGPDSLKEEGPLLAKLEVGDAELELDVQVFEGLDKWRRCERQVGQRLVFEQNLARAENTGFPSCADIGKSLGLTTHEVAAVFGWTTGDYRFLNPIARGEEEVTFEDYLDDRTRVVCQLHRSEVLPYVRILGRALQKLPPQQPVAPPPSKAPGAAAAAPAALWRGHRRRIPARPGAVIALRGFTSASYDMDEALKFAAQANAGRSAQRTLLAILEYCTGRCIARLSARRFEGEVLFPLDARFVVADPPQGPRPEEAAVESAREALRGHLGPEADLVVVYLREATGSQTTEQAVEVR